MFVICYTDTDNKQHYGIVRADSIHDVEEQYKNVTIDFIFKNNDELRLKENEEASRFYNLCGRYGFSPSDYLLQFKGSNDQPFEFCGFLPQNRKYKCQIRNTLTKQTFRVTPDYIRKYGLGKL